MTTNKNSKLDFYKGFGGGSVLGGEGCRWRATRDFDACCIRVKMTFTPEFSAVLGDLQMLKRQTCSRVRFMSVTNPDTTSGVEIDLAG
ncbi:hypothetical protein TNIN_500761 [Trichonephila inaurata madagascariensis]|uniref:Uncharacterized protein n=1 Tax=Trichonephila inaurata madagascariensis TaxID=2747483 RepID=A0A8X6XD95_9ARAC|nr:hypothetical protein TNIN_403711 [Trichonephila inaurata madagascariensis]GFY51638.1 hypothetical protein TNIN_500761 [Trichonephila inaurata madagascariensis]